uniref:Uncharacterized protein n=1 Tax=Kalanchoe fedtschenkoi TaxID=63787 RepID=A0A7N0V6Q0_KALFE
MSNKSRCNGSVEEEEEGCRTPKRPTDKVMMVCPPAPKKKRRAAAMQCPKLQQGLPNDIVYFHPPDLEILFANVNASNTKQLQHLLSVSV